MNYMTHPYPGELIYSTVARYQRNMNISSTKVSDLIFSIHARVNNHKSGFVITKLDMLSQKLKSGYTGETLLNQNTTLRYDSAFYSNSNKDIAKSTFLNRGTLYQQFRRENLRYCPNCYDQDIKDYGEPYFHTHHQLEGVFICPICHTPLVNHTCDKIFDYICLEDLPKSNDSLDIPSVFCEIADMAIQLMNSQICLDDSDASRAKLVTLLKKRNALINRTITKKIIEEVREAYKTDEIVSRYYKFSIDDICNEMSKVCLKKERPIVRTITYLILIHYLVGNLENFKNAEPDKNISTKKQGTNKQSLVKNDRLLKKHRQILLDLAEEKNLTRRLLYLEYTSTYYYLKRHDNEWLESKIPKPFSTYTQEYNEADDIRIKAIIHDEKAKLLENGERIYIANLRRNRDLRLHMRRLHLLPISNEYINSITETNDEYFRRKIRNAVDELYSKDMEVSYNKIINMASNNSMFEFVKIETDLYLKEIGLNNIRIHKCSTIRVGKQ